MKKQILLLVTVLISTITFSQHKSTFGIRAGLTSSHMAGDAVNNLKDILEFTDGMITTNNRTGFFTGGFVTLPINNIFTIEPAVYYSQKGYEMKGALDLKGVAFLGANASVNLNSAYLDIPLVVKANFNGLQLFAGPQISYLMEAALQTKAGILGFNLLNKKIDATSQFNRYDMAFTAGLGYQFLNGLNILASYDHGLSKADAKKSLNSYNRSFKVGIGFRL